MPLANAFAGMRHFSIERDYLLREIPTPAYRDALFGDRLANDRIDYDGRS